MPNIDQVNVQNRMAQAQPNLPPDVNQFGLTMRKSDRPADADRRRSTRRSKTYDALFLANYANINIIDALYRVPGVGEVRIFGAGDYAMRIWVKPDLLAQARARPCPTSRARSSSRARSIRPARSARNPAPPGQEMTYTVRAQGRLQTAEEFGDDRRALESRRLGRAPAGRRAHRARRAQLPADRPRQRPAGRAPSRVFQAPGSNALAVAEGVAADDGGAAARASRRTSSYALHARHDAGRSPRASARS